MICLWGISNKAKLYVPALDILTPISRPVQVLQKKGEDK